MFDKVSKAFIAATAGVAVTIGGISACSGLDTTADGAHTQGSLTPVWHEDAKAFSPAVEKLANSRVIYVGESHGRYGHHINQLAVIRALHGRGVKLAIGAAFFQRPFQSHLDAFIRGEIGDEELLAATQYHRRWRYDFRLYSPILEFARQEGIPVVALNAPTELVRLVSNFGWLGVGEAAKLQLPPIRVPPSRAYEQRLRDLFADHPPRGGIGFDVFMQVRLLRDEYMAESAAEYLLDEPDRTLVVLADSGHVRGGLGIPERLARRTPGAYSIVLSGLPGEVSKDDADLALLELDGASQQQQTIGIRVDLLPDGFRLRVREGGGGELPVRRL